MLKNKKVLIFVILLSLLLGACAPKNKSSNPSGDARNENQPLQVTVSILPQKWFVDRIAGDLAQTQAMVGTGDDPHSYEPSPAQMVALGKSALYFTIEIEFEDAWMERFLGANTSLRVVDSSAGIERIAMVGSHHHDEDEHGEHGDEQAESEEAHDAEHDHEGLDPHVWFSSENAKLIANNIANALVEVDPQNKDFYQRNLQAVLSEIEETDLKVRDLLKDITLDHFMIVHPAWGYFAHEYGLYMIPVEIDGSEPGPEDLANILNAAQEFGARVLFVEKGTNMNLARSVAKQAAINQIIEWDPMAYNWPENMLSLAEDLKEALR